MNRTTTRSIALTCCWALCATTLADEKPPQGWMVRATKPILNETFSPGKVSSRWFFRRRFTVADGHLIRNEIAGENKRLFWKDPKIANAIIQLDFSFRGASELRIMTGGGGHYNTIVMIHPDRLRVNTARDQEAGFYPSIQGECAAKFERGQWYTLTIEFLGDQTVVHLNDEQFVVGRHPIIDRTRTYFAFQVDQSGAAFDNVKIWDAAARDGWASRRRKLLAVQQARKSVPRDPQEQIRDLTTIVRDRLKRTDKKYQALVQRVDELKAEAKTTYPAVYQTSKEFGKKLAARRKELRKTDPDYKRLENAINLAKRAEREFLHSRDKTLESAPQHRYWTAMQRLREKLRDDAAYRKVSAVIVAREKEIRDRYAELFLPANTAIENRRRERESLKDNANFRQSLKMIADAVRAEREYLTRSEPRLKLLEEQVRAAKTERKK